MKKKSLLAAGSVFALAAMTGTAYHLAEASDHDDGENDSKNRNLNLTDHFTFKSTADATKLSMIMYFNPRSLPGKQYTLNTKARYEFHVTKVAALTTVPTAMENFVFRFEAGAPDANGVQAITTTVIKDGVVAGTNTGATTAYAVSKANILTGAGSITTNTGTVGGIDLKYFVGMRADSFTFDVHRFFQVRAFLADRFFGGVGGLGNAAASLAPNCRGDAFLAGSLGNTETNADADGVNMFNPSSCAPDFTKNFNVTAIVLNVPITQLGGGTIFDTWSTISVKEVN